MGNLTVGASVNVTLKFNVPATITKFSATEPGNFKDHGCAPITYATAQQIAP
jgi:hypothetical protein